MVKLGIKKDENRKLVNGLKIENTESMEYFQKLVNFGMLNGLI